MFSIRLATDMENRMTEVSKMENVSKSEIIKRALDLFFRNYHRDNSPYEIGKDLFGKHGSGKGNLSKDYKKLLKEKLGEKYSR